MVQSPLHFGAEPTLIAPARRLLLVNREYVWSNYGGHVQRLEATLDGLHEYIYLHTWVFHLRTPPTALQKILASASYKSLIGSFSILESVLNGLYGSARPIFRQILEAQVLAKFAATAASTDIAERWLSKESLSVSRQVFPRLPHRVADPLRTFWRSSHSYVHHTTGAQQVHLVASENDASIAHDLTILGALLHIQHHLLTQFTFDRRDRRDTIRYKEEGAVESVTLRLKQLLREDLAFHGKDVRSFIRAFRANWATDRAAASKHSRVAP